MWNICGQGLGDGEEEIQLDYWKGKNEKIRGCGPRV